jgi:hypothetical protein
MRGRKGSSLEEKTKRKKERMKLLTKAIESKIPTLYATDGQKEKTAICKFFTPDANFTWYVVEGKKETNGDWTFFGLVDAGSGSEWAEKEWGYFTLGQLQSVRGKMGLPVERDRWFEGVKIDNDGPIQG